MTSKRIIGFAPQNAETFNFFKFILDLPVLETDNCFVNQNKVSFIASFKESTLVRNGVIQKEVFIKKHLGYKAVSLFSHKKVN